MAKIVSSSNRPRSPGLLSNQSAVAKQNSEKTLAAVTALHRAIARSPLRTQNAQQQLAQTLVFDLLAMTPYPAEFRDGFNQMVKAIVTKELTTLYEAPANPQTHDPMAAHQTRIQVSQQLKYFEAETDHIEAFKNNLVPVLRTLTTACRQQQRQAQGSLSIETPLYSLFTDPVATIDQLVRQLSKLASDPNDPTPVPGSQLGNRVIANVLTTSRLTFEEAQKRPYRITWPSDSKLTPGELVDAYLEGTPLAELLKTTLSLPIPDSLLPETVMITAVPGHGKTQLLQSMVLNHLNNPAKPSVVIMDSQADCLQVLSHLKRFDPALGDNLTIIDPTDIHLPALNLFAWNRALADTLKPSQREEMLQGVIETFKFTCEALIDTGLTPRMQMVFQYLALWIMEIPDATLLTLIDLLRSPEPYLQYTLNLSPTVQGFIQELFAERSSYKQTIELILSRLHAVVSNPTFEQMFAHPQNKFDIGTAMNTPGHVTFINTAKAQLKADCSALFGRFWLGKIYQATMARAFIPSQQRNLSVVLIDEAHEYLSGAEATVEQLLFQARKYLVSINLIHQTCSQMRKAGVLDATLGIPALRYTGAISDADANLLAKEMRTTPEFLKSVRKTTQSAEWAVFARNITQTATVTNVQFLQAEREPKMSEAAYQRLLERNRQKVAAPRQHHQTSNRNTNAPTNNDGDDY